MLSGFDFFLFSDRIYRIKGIFFPCGKRDALRPKAPQSKRSCKSCLIFFFRIRIHSSDFAI
ncbi:hypothetical protein D1AOALGA4SA_2171 [Olavius algarvensis Delta 1 endosymbiont]|nr:hypothetical protein D1AOALGA4SA_2171 [Olavius algarvensis Delta 1 endosymbiont]